MKKVQESTPVAAQARARNRGKNVLFGLSGGWLLCLYFAATAAVYAATIIGVKKAYTLLKCGYFCSAPYGKNAHLDFASHKVGNAWWTATLGWQAALLCMLLCAFWSVTVAGLPLAKRYFLLAQYTVAPFGAKLYPSNILFPERAIAHKRDEHTDYEI